MKKAVKKRIGRPPGRVAPRRPVVSARVPEAAYEELKAAARTAGRTMSEELVAAFLARQEWTKAFGELDEWKAKFREEHAEIARGNLEAVLFGRNWKKVRGVRFGNANWISPDNHAYPQSGFIDLPAEAKEAEAAADEQPKERKQG